MRIERDRKLEEHKQRVKALQESEYSIDDNKRARAADEMMWLDFETRIRALV